MIKKTITILTAFCLVFTSAFGGASAITYANTSENGEGNMQPVPEVLSVDTEYARDPETGYIYPLEEMDVPESKTAMANPEGRNKASLPAQYPTGGISEITSTYPATRSQSPYGTCWAHASVACAEFDLVKNHQYYGPTLDLSELQLAYFTYHTANDKLGNLDGDENYMSSNAVENYLNVGGNAAFAIQNLAQWKGLASDSGDLAYSNAVNSPSYSINSAYAYQNDRAKLENAYLIDIKSNPAAVKEAIQTYGAVDASYYSNDAYYYSNNNGYYCYDTGLGTNHDIAIVGWNDNFAANSFPEGKRPSRNGAWLVRNSWSTANNQSESCYFWMSYDDKSLANTVYVMDFVPGTKYANIYQHDGANGDGSIGVEKAANVFTAKNPENRGSEALQAVMVSFTYEADVQYQIDIYSGLPTGTTTNPEAGYHHTYATTTGTTTHAGIHTIYLKQPVYLAPGEKYAIVVTSKNGQVWFDTEYTKAYTYKEGTATVGWFTSVGSADRGESLYKTRTSNNGWGDVVDFTGDLSGYENFRIKGLTTNSDIKKYTVTYQLNGGTAASGNPAWYLSNSGSTTLKTPTRAGYHFLGWYTDSGYTNKITTISGSLGRNLTLYAKWCSDGNASQTTILSRATASGNGSYKVTCGSCGIVKGTYTTYKASSIKLNSTKLAYSGKNKNPYPVIKDANGKKLVNGTDYTYKYSKSTRKSVGRYYVTVTFKNKYSGSKKLYYTVVPKAPSSASAKLYGYDDIKVSWSKCTGASGYYVYYKTSKSSKYSKYKRTTKRSIKFSNLSDNVKYNFKIVPYYKSGDTRYKSTKYKVVSTTTLKKLKQPSMKKASAGRVSLKWKSISGASGYQVYWAKTKNGKYRKLCDYSKKYSGVTFSVGKGETYWYKTRAYKKVGSKKIYGPWSTTKKYKR